MSAEVSPAAPDGLADERDTLEKQKCRAAEPRTNLAGGVMKIMGISFRMVISNDLCMSMYAMVCNGMQWYAMVCNGMQWYAMVCNVCNVMYVMECM